jgi:hypothetical protein
MFEQATSSMALGNPPARFPWIIAVKRKSALGIGEGFEVGVVVG